MRKNALAMSIALLIGSVGMAGCAAYMPQTPQQTIYAAKGAYATALTAAVAYKRLPECSAAVKPPCHTRAAVEQLQKADIAASSALDSAETVVRNPSFGKDVVASALAASQAALTAFVTITTSLGVK